MVKEVKKKSSGIPMVIIVLVLVVVVVGGFLFYRTSNPANRAATTTTNTVNNGAPQRPPMDLSKAPPGAQPPNSIGSPTATVTVEEFADFQCGSCASAHPVLKEITSAYGSNKNFRFIFRNYPLSMHDKAYTAAAAAEAAGLQGTSKFWQMQDRLFSNQHLWATNSNYRDVFAGYAKEIGLDVEKFKADMSGMQAKTRVDQDLARGQAVGISSTPTVIVNGKVIPYAEVNSAGLRRIIDAELLAASSQGSTTAPANSK